MYLICECAHSKHICWIFRICANKAKPPLHIGTIGITHFVSRNAVLKMQIIASSNSANTLIVLACREPSPEGYYTGGELQERGSEQNMNRLHLLPLASSLNTSTNAKICACWAQNGLEQP